MPRILESTHISDYRMGRFEDVPSDVVVNHIFNSYLSHMDIVVCGLSCKTLLAMSRLSNPNFDDDTNKIIDVQKYHELFPYSKNIRISPQLPSHNNTYLNILASFMSSILHISQMVISFVFVHTPLPTHWDISKYISDDISKWISELISKLISKGIPYRELPEFINNHIKISTLDLAECKFVNDDIFAQLSIDGQLSGLHTLNISNCNNISDNTFKHLSSLHSLNMDNCYNENITDEAFKHLSNLESLYMNFCNLNTITDNAFSHLTGLHTLQISSFYDGTITDGAFRNLSNLHTLEICMFMQHSLTDMAFIHLPKLHTLNISYCNISAITDGAFVHFGGLHTLTMRACRQPTITDTAFVNLNRLHTLVMSECHQHTITDAAFGHLAGLHTLDIHGCYQTTITDAAFGHLTGLRVLDMSECHQSTITNAAFEHLRGLHTLNMNHCTQETITDAAFVHLSGLHTLQLEIYSRNIIMDRALGHLKGMHHLTINGNDQTLTNDSFRSMIDLHTLVITNRINYDLFGNNYINDYTSKGVLDPLGGNSLEMINGTLFKYSDKLHTLDIRGHHRIIMTDNILECLCGESLSHSHRKTLNTLILDGCVIDNLSEDGYKYLGNLDTLKIKNCNIFFIPDPICYHLSRIPTIKIYKYNGKLLMNRCRGVDMKSDKCYSPTDNYPEAIIFLLGDIIYITCNTLIRFTRKIYKHSMTYNKYVRENIANICTNFSHFSMSWKLRR